MLPKTTREAFEFGKVEASFWVGAVVAGSSLLITWLCSPPAAVGNCQELIADPFPSC